MSGGNRLVSLQAVVGVQEGRWRSRTVDVVFKDSGFVDGREVAGAMDQSGSWPGASSMGGATYPLVKTFSNDVFPQAPSPLLSSQVSGLVLVLGWIAAEGSRWRGEKAHAQQDQLALNRLGTSAESRHRVGLWGGVVVVEVEVGVGGAGSRTARSSDGGISSVLLGTRRFVLP